MSNLLEITNLTKSYEGFSLKIDSFAIPTGSVVGFVGSNGAGKTTTIKTALGLIAPDGGTVSFFSTELVASDGTHAGSQLAAAKERIGVVFDTCPFPGDMRVEDVGYMGRFSYKQWDKTLFQKYLSAFSLDGKKQIKDLSRGMGMKLQLAFAFSHNPDLLILDEVTAGLDPLARQEVLELLRTYMEDESHGILISSHITTDLERIADMVICINEGRVLFQRSIDEICDFAGIARCRMQDIQAIEASGLFQPGDLRIIRNDYSVDVLIPSRSAFHAAFPSIVCERTSLDAYMLFMLKGDIR